MAPNSRLILTRHAQAEHNVGLDYSSMYESLSGSDELTVVQYPMPP